MHEKLSNTMTKLEAAPETVNKDLQYKLRCQSLGRGRRAGHDVYGMG